MSTVTWLSAICHDFATEFICFAHPLSRDGSDSLGKTLVKLHAGDPAFPNALNS